MDSTVGWGGERSVADPVESDAARAPGPFMAPSAWGPPALSSFTKIATCSVITWTYTDLQQSEPSSAA